MGAHHVTTQPDEPLAALMTQHPIRCHIHNTKDPEATPITPLRVGGRRQTQAQPQPPRVNTTQLTTRLRLASERHTPRHGPETSRTHRTRIAATIHTRSTMAATQMQGGNIYR